MAPETIDNTDPPDIFIAPFIQATVVLVVSVDLEVVAALDQNLDRIGLVSGASVYPLGWNILLAARNEGCGGNLTSMAIPQEAQVQQLLGLPDTHALAALVPLRKPTRQLTKLRRQPSKKPSPTNTSTVHPSPAQHTTDDTASTHRNRSPDVAGNQPPRQTSPTPTT